MRKQTTTQQINAAISSNLLHITKAEKYNKSTRQTEKIDIDTFKEGMEFLGETLFADCIGWHYEKDYWTGDYEVECGRMDGSVDFIITAYLCLNDGVNGEKVERILEFMEEE